MRYPDSGSGHVRSRLRGLYKSVRRIRSDAVACPCDARMPDRRLKEGLNLKRSLRLAKSGCQSDRHPSLHLGLACRNAGGVAAPVDPFCLLVDKQRREAQGPEREADTVGELTGLKLGRGDAENSQKAEAITPALERHAVE